MGPGDAVWLGTGIALPTPPSPPLPRVHPSPHPPAATVAYSVYSGCNSGVGLKSVAQLTLDAYFSGFLSMTEVYNLLIAGIPNNHYLIPGNE